MSTLSPNMNLVLPTIGVDSGLIWEQSVNTNSSILDGHNHSVGSGVQITTSGLNINTDLPLNGNNLISLRSSRYQAQSAPLSLATDLGCTYVSGADLYYNDVNGNQIQITSGGTVNATSSGISSGTATASFSGSVLVVNSASNTPANIQGASLLLGNTGVSGSNYLTLSPPSALANNYSLTLPAIPGAISFMSIDTSGNLAAYAPVSQGIVGSNIASATITGSNVASATIAGSNIISQTITQGLLAIRPTGTSVAAGGVAISNSSGTFSTTSGSFVQVTNFSITLVTTGRPVMILIQPDGTSNQFEMLTISGGGVMQLQRDSNAIANYVVGSQSDHTFPPMLDTPAAGTHTYTFFVMASSSNFLLQHGSLIAYEL